MRNMSFALTRDQVRKQQKTVTRRCGWRTAKRGDIVQPIEKGQGLKKGESPKPIGAPIRFLNVSVEALNMITRADVVREGFPTMSAEEFIAMFCEHNGTTPSDDVVRIEFEYLPPGYLPAGVTSR